MNELYDQDKLLIQFPLWLLIHHRFNRPSGESIVQLFTDKNLAKRFRNADSNLAGYTLGLIGDALRLLAFLKAFEKQGLTHVTFDPGKSGQTPADIYRIADLRKHLPGPDDAMKATSSDWWKE